MQKEINSILLSLKQHLKKVSDVIIDKNDVLYFDYPLHLNVGDLSDLVVGALHDETGGLHVTHDVVTEIAEVIHGGDREVATLVLHLVAAVAAVLDPARVPGAGLGIDVVVRRVRCGVETDVVEHVELRLGGEESRVRDPGGGQICLGLASDVAGVSAVGFLRQRVVDEEIDVEGPRPSERVDEGRGGIGEQGHVRLVDLLETGDRGAVEAQALGEDLGSEGAGWNREVLHHAR